MPLRPPRQRAGTIQAPAIESFTDSLIARRVIVKVKLSLLRRPVRHCRKKNCLLCVLGACARSGIRGLCLRLTALRPFHECHFDPPANTKNPQKCQQLLIFATDCRPLPPVTVSAQKIINTLVVPKTRRRRTLVLPAPWRQAGSSLGSVYQAAAVAAAACRPHNLGILDKVLSSFAPFAPVQIPRPPPLFFRPFPPFSSLPPP